MPAHLPDDREFWRGHYARAAGVEPGDTWGDKVAKLNAAFAAADRPRLSTVRVLDGTREEIEARHKAEVEMLTARAKSADKWTEAALGEADDAREKLAAARSSLKEVQAESRRLRIAGLLGMVVSAAVGVSMTLLVQGGMLP
mgnify:FL=1